MFDTIVFDTQKRINDPEQMAALDAMRLCKADSGTLNFWQSKCIEESRRFDGTCLTIYALQSKVRDHNETMLKNLRTKQKTVELHAIDTSEGQSILFPSSIERNCMADQILTLAPGVPVFINRNVLARCISTFKEIYVGNGTPAVVSKIEPNDIVVELESGLTVKMTEKAIAKRVFTKAWHTWRYHAVIRWKFWV